MWSPVGGSDGRTSTVDVVAKVGMKMAEVFARGGTAREAKAAGNAILNRHPNDGDVLVLDKLVPLDQPEE